MDKQYRDRQMFKYMQVAINVCFFLLGIAWVLALTGCSTLPTSEVAYVAVHSVDTAQTVEIAREKNKYAESASAWYLGRHPSEKAVYLWSASEFAIHAAVSSYLYTHDDSKALAVWQVVTIGDAANDVKGNFSIGLKFGF